MATRNFSAELIHRLENIVTFRASRVCRKVLSAYSRDLERVAYHFAGGLKLFRVVGQSRHRVVHHNLNWEEIPKYSICAHVNIFFRKFLEKEENNEVIAES